MDDETLEIATRLARAEGRLAVHEALAARARVRRPWLESLSPHWAWAFVAVFAVAALLGHAEQRKDAAVFQAWADGYETARAFYQNLSP